ncbi:MAG: S-layer protein [Candidatus Woesearchaeota archaeon]
MKVRKAIKKIAALGAGITMVGATILGATAADLSNYPSPFVKDGQFNGLIVVGDQAAAEDVVGAVDIGASLQYAMRQEAAVSGGGQSAVTISEGKKIEKVGNRMNYGEEIEDVLGAPLDEEDLPVILADENYNDNEGQTDNKEDYSQRLYFLNTTGATGEHDDLGTGQLIFEQDDDGEELADDYLVFDDGSGDNMYRYKLLFDSSVEFTNSSTNTPAEDLEDTVLTIQGDDYTLIDVQYDSSTYALEKLTFLSGETIIWLQQGKTIKRTLDGTEHEVEVTDVNDAEDMCGVSVDGDVVWIDTGKTQTVNGVTIGVTDAVAVHAQLQDVDICKLNVGAREITMEDGKEISVDGDDVDNSNADILGDTSGGEWDGLNITYEVDDEEFIPAGGSITDPVFGKFEVRFEGMSKSTEEMSLDSSSDDATFTFENNNGDEVEIPYYHNELNFGNDNITMGEDYETENCDGRLLLEGENCDITGSDYGEIEGVQFLLVTNGKEAHVMEVESIDNGTDETTADLYDVTLGKSYDDKDITLDGNPSSIELGSLGTIQLTFNGTTPSFTATDVNLESDGKIETKKGAELSFGKTFSDNSTEINVTEGDDTEDNNRMAVSTSLYFDEGSDDSIEINTPELIDVEGNSWHNPGVQASDDDSDTEYYVTEWGTKVTYDSDDKNDLTIEYPEGQVYGNVFVAPVGASVSGAAGGELTTVTLNQINVAAKLASEVEGQETTQNLIAVGGPAINKASAVLMGLDFPASGDESGIESGTAMIKLYENGDNVAMVVAGYDAEDTRRATTVMANHEDYDLSGDEVVVTGTSLSDITVNAPE